MITKILKILLENNTMSQRKISEYLDISLGSVNKYLNQAIEQDLLLKEVISYRKTKYTLTEAGRKSIKDEGVSTAVILIAGKSKDFEVSVGQLEVGKETLIESHIKKLRACKIKRIILIVGFNKEYFINLKKVYNDIEIIENKNYKNTGNMYSLYLARNQIQEDFLLIDGDIVYEKNIIKNILDNKQKNISVITKVLKNTQDTLYTDIENERLVGLSKDKYSLQNISGQLVGISKIQYKFFLKMIEKFSKINNSLYFYEYFFIDKTIFDNFYCLKMDNLIWGEIDNKKQYKHILDNILPKLMEGKN
ncbi:NTP transferase domain-containing protein [Cetobacterium sp.]|uniref:NTP transferase domain-containing protein n=1 Tax=Cetobacterium sp. TaxID=2071632 RepID=UPI002FCA6A28